MYPTVNPEDKPKRGRARKFPEFVEFDCPACQRRWPKTDPQHTRRETPPQLCRFPEVEPMVITCPACLKRKAADHPDDTHDEGCRSPASRTTGVRRRGGDVRTPALRANGDSDERRQQNDDHDLDRDPTAASSGAPAAPHMNNPADPLSGPAPSTREEERAEGTHQPQPELAEVADAPPGADVDADDQREPEPGITVPLRP